MIVLLQQPWCFATLLGVCVLLFLGAALQVRQQRAARFASPQVLGFPPETYPVRSVAASAPLEALVALEARLQELQRHLPPNSSDARWLAGFLRQLRATMDYIYDRLAACPPQQHAALLARIGSEVASLDGVVNLHLGATLNRSTDRDALEAQLDALRESI